MKFKLNLKSQFNTVKDNWLLIAIIIVLFIVISASNSSGTFQTFSKASVDYAAGYGEEMALARAPGYYGDDDFAPEEEDRLITKTGHLTTEVKRGEFQEAETDLKNIIKASDGYLLNLQAQNQDVDQENACNSQQCPVWRPTDNQSGLEMCHRTLEVVLLSM